MALGKMFMERDEIKKMDYVNQVESLNDRLSKIQSALDNKEIQNALDKQSKLTESKKTYLNQTDFGSCFNVKISNVAIGKLLRIIGLAMKSRTYTTPYDRYCPKYATGHFNKTAKQVVFKWNYNECIKVLDQWLQDHNLYVQFYSKTDRQELTDFINYLHEKHVLTK